MATTTTMIPSVAHCVELVNRPPKKRHVATWRLVSWTLFIVLLIVGSGVILFLGGCQSLGGKSNSQQYQLAATSYTMTVNAIVGLSRANLVDLDDLERFEAARSGADVLLTAWHQALIEGRTFSGLEALNALLDQMITIQLKSEGAARDGPNHRIRSRISRGQTRRRSGRHDQRRARGRPRSDIRRDQPRRSRAHAGYAVVPG